MTFKPYNFRLNSDVLKDGEYYVFRQQEGKKNRIGYIYTTWCGHPCQMRMSFSLAELGKPLPLFSIGESQSDKGQLKIFNFDSKNPRLIDEAYNRAESWLKKMQRELKYPQLDESTGCKPAVIVVNKWAVSAFYGKDEFLNAFFETFDLRL